MHLQLSWILNAKACWRGVAIILLLLLMPFLPLLLLVFFFDFKGVTA